MRSAPSDSVPDIFLDWLEEDGDSLHRRVPVTWGVPWKEGSLRGNQEFTLTGKSKSPLPVQSWITAYWADGSTKWTAHAAVVPKDEGPFCLSPYEQEAGEPASFDEIQSYLDVGETERAVLIDTGAMEFTLPKSGRSVITDISRKGVSICSGGELFCIKETQSGSEGSRKCSEEPFRGLIDRVVVENSGPVRCVVKIEGIHKSHDDRLSWLPFVLRLYFYAGSADIRGVYNFTYTGDAQKDRIKGLGIHFKVPMKGPLYNRHVRMAGDKGMFGEACQFISRRHPLYKSLYPRQVKGRMLDVECTDDDLVQDMAVWDNFKLIQDSSEHYVISKNTNERCSWVDGLHGHRSKGLVFCGSEEGGLAAGVKDFWQKYPASLEVSRLSSDEAMLKVWLWSPQGPAMDLRHYDTVTHKISSYEGTEDFQSDPVGIANTSEFRLFCYDRIPDNSELVRASDESCKPPLLVCSPGTYHRAGAFGVWSLRDRGTEIKDYLEDQLDRAIEFYQDEVEQRKWYGFWHYGDIMHSYDEVRSCWKYDVGGFAWQNTELVPNMWLWLSFLRSGRSDIFRLAEAMTRHTSEVDMYHLGDFLGLGSRHNVIHWGCGSKEARISMAGLHRYYYYLTADERLGDVFSQSLNAEFSTLALDPMREYYPDDQFPSHARSGPDWAAYCSNWFTQWERFDDTAYAVKIKEGIDCLKKMPFGLRSGSCFGFDPETARLHYMGEDTYGYHLAVCMGEPQVWMELASVLKDPQWEEMLIEFGEFYLLSREEKVKRTSEAISKNWHWPMFATGIIAYAAAKRGDCELARRVWQIILDESGDRALDLPIGCVRGEGADYPHPVNEIPTITTNAASQWCLNVIICLELIGDSLDNRVV